MCASAPLVTRHLQQRIKPMSLAKPKELLCMSACKNITHISRRISNLAKVGVEAGEECLHKQPLALHVEALALDGIAVQLRGLTSTSNITSYAAWRKSKYHDLPAATILEER